MTTTLISGDDIDKFLDEMEVKALAYQKSQAEANGEKPARKSRKRKKPDDGEERDIEAEIDEAANGRAAVHATADEHIVNLAVESTLAADDEVFQRAGELVKVRQASAKNAFDSHAISKPLLRHMISERVFFFEAGDNYWNQEHPPGHVVDSLYGMGEWPTIRRLEGVIPCPSLRPDGSIITASGFDEPTGLYLPRALAIPNVCELAGDPSRDDARAAMETLAGLVQDFPFREVVDFSAWLAGALTPIARHAIDGPIPMFLIVANQQGSGKTLLVDLVSMIFTGRKLPRSHAASDNDELEKRIFALARSAPWATLLDNAATSIGGAALDAALTSGEITSRILGKSEQQTVSLRTIFYATGNNLAIKGDLARRIVPVRLMTPEENPERRNDFIHPDVLRYTRENRTDLVVAALRILRAFFLAGRPSQGLSRFGSFEDWSHVVREAVVWLGLPDPLDAVSEIVESGDTTAMALDAILESLPQLERCGKGLTTQQIIDAAQGDSPAASLLAEALASLCRDPKSVREVGQRLRTLRDRPRGGVRLVVRKGKGKQSFWQARATGTTERASNGGQGVACPEGHGGQATHKPPYKPPRNEDANPLKQGENSHGIATGGLGGLCFTTLHAREDVVSESGGVSAVNTPGPERPEDKPPKPHKPPSANETTSLPRTSSPPHDARQPDDQQSSESPPDAPGPSPDEPPPPPSDAQASNSAPQTPAGGDPNVLI